MYDIVTFGEAMIRLTPACGWASVPSSARGVIAACRSMPRSSQRARRWLSIELRERCVIGQRLKGRLRCPGLLPSPGRGGLVVVAMLSSCGRPYGVRSIGDQARL